MRSKPMSWQSLRPSSGMIFKERSGARDPTKVVFPTPLAPIAIIRRLLVISLSEVDEGAPELPGRAGSVAVETDESEQL